MGKIIRKGMHNTHPHRSRQPQFLLCTNSPDLNVTREGNGSPIQHNLGPALFDNRSLPDHGRDIAALHISQTEREPFLNSGGELIFGDG